MRTNAELSWNARKQESKLRWLKHAQDEKNHQNHEKKVCLPFSNIVLGTSGGQVSNVFRAL